MILIGRGGCLIGADYSKGFHLRLTAPLEWRAQQVAESHQIPVEEAERRIVFLDGARAEFFQKTLGREISDPHLYDLILRQTSYPVDRLASLVIRAMEAKGLLAQPPRALAVGLK